MLIRILFTVFIAFSIVACFSYERDGANTQHNQTKHLTVTGSSTLAPLIAEIAKAYEHMHPDVRIDVQAGGSSRGITDTREGLADIGMVSKHIASNDELQAHLVARDGVTLIVHRDNPIGFLDKKTITDIYLGHIVHWSQIQHDHNGEIIVVSKAEGRSTLSVFLEYLNRRNSELKPDTIIGDNEQAIKLVANNRNAIAYVSTSTAEYNIQQGVPIKAINVDNVEPIEQNIASGVFPIVRELNLITRRKPNDFTQDFLNFIKTSDAANKLTREFKFVPII